MRKSGLLLHPTSLPGPEGIGTLGEEARRFVDQLVRAGQRYWQVLPLGPTGLFDSPYMASSALAGNPLLIDIETTIKDGWLRLSEVEPAPFSGQDSVDYEGLKSWKLRMLRVVYGGFQSRASEEVKRTFKAFCHTHSAWLEDFALFEVLCQLRDGAPWYAWPVELRQRHADVLEAVTREHRVAIAEVKFQQFLFFSQWLNLKAYANSRGVELIGDIPIFVAHNSADVWVNRGQFFLNDEGQPTVVAGVPPDYFSATGQRWGNPLYNWAEMAADGYGWWIERFRVCMLMVDQVRLDHFRGFESYWEIPASHPTALNGTWKPGPGSELFNSVKAALGEVPIIAEDLGIITPAVEALRDELGFPGMKVLHFAFGEDAANAYLPHNFESSDCVVYTGTHDNDTTVGWYKQAPEEIRHHVRVYLSVSGDDIAWDLIRCAWRSSAKLAIVPVQDLLSLDSDARMNVPGEGEGNWRWRMRSDALSEPVLDRMRYLNELYGR